MDGLITTMGMTLPHIPETFPRAIDAQVQDRMHTRLSVMNVAALWPQIEELLKLDKSLGLTHNLNDIHKMIMAHRVDVWIQFYKPFNCLEALVITEFVNYPRGLFLRAWIACCLPTAKLDDEAFYHLISNWASNNNCIGMQAVGGGGTNTVETSTSIPAYEQGQSEANMQLADSLAQTPYPNYSGQLVAPMTSYQNAGIAGAGQNAYSFVNGLNNATASTANAMSSGYNPQQIMSQGPNPYSGISSISNEQSSLEPSQAMSIPGQTYAPSVQSAQQAVQPAMSAQGALGTPVQGQNPYASYNQVVQGPNAQSAANSVVSAQSPNSAYSGIVQGPNASSIPGSVVQANNPNFVYNTQVQAPSVNSGQSNVVNAGSPISAFDSIVNGMNPNSVYSSLNNAPNSNAAIQSMGGSVQGAANNAFNNAGAQTWNNNAAQQYMSPYEQAALNPQLQQMQEQLGQQQQAINAQSTQANAFGDARQGVESALANQNADLQMANVEAQGMNTAYTTGQQAFQADQANKLSAYNTGGQLGLNAQQQAITGGQAEQGLAQSAFTANQNAAAQQSATGLNAFNAAQNAANLQSNANISNYNSMQNAAAQQSATGLNAFNANQSAAQGQSATNLNALLGQQSVAAGQSATNLNAYNAGQSAAAQQSATNLNALTGQQNIASQQTANNMSAFTGEQNAAAQQSQTNLNAYNAALQGSQNQEALNLQGALGANTINNTQVGNNLAAFGQALQGNENYSNQYLTAEQNAQNAYGQNVGLGQNAQQLQLAGAAQQGSLANQTQNQYDTAANTLYGAGSAQQNLTQQQLNTAYSQFLNQSQWPYQQLAVQESALSNNPYVMGNATTLPATNSVATGLSSFSQLAGGLGSLFSNGAAKSGTSASSTTGL
ncbi:unnamed protein product [Sphagnum balticum]